MMLGGWEPTCRRLESEHYLSSCPITNTYMNRKIKYPSLRSETQGRGYVWKKKKERKEEKEEKMKEKKEANERKKEKELPEENIRKCFKIFI